MNMKIHYLITLYVLVLWGLMLIARSPQVPFLGEERINMNSEIQYRFD
jgi:hypothetical protein